MRKRPTALRYKMGDKVLIKSKEWFNTQPKNEDGNIDFGYIIFNKRMINHCGEEHIITMIHDDCVYKLNYTEWDWSDEMLDDIKSLRKSKLKKNMPKEMICSGVDKNCYENCPHNELHEHMGILCDNGNCHGTKMPCITSIKIVRKHKLQKLNG